MSPSHTASPSPASPALSRQGKAKVLIVDDHPIFREGLRQIVNAEPDFEVLSEASSAAQALAVAAEDPPDIAIVDLTLDHSNGIDLIKDLDLRWQGLPVLVLSNHDEALYAERCIRAGARGYVMKDRPPADLIAALHDVLQGGFHVSPAITGKILSKLGRASVGSAGEPTDGLSDRELQVFELYGRGRTTRQIAGLLHLSAKTVESHRDHIKQKLAFSDSAKLVRAAVQWVETHHGL